MKILFDTNIILDLLLARKPLYIDALKLISAAETSVISVYLCIPTLTTIQYLIMKTLSKSESKKHIKKILSIFNITPINKIVLERAIDSTISDFDYAVINESAIISGLDDIVARNTKDFRKSKLSIYGPAELSAILKL